MQLLPAFLRPAMAPAAPRRFVRTRVPPVERALSASIMVLLAAIAAAIVWKGARFDPGQYALRPEALASTTADVEGKAGTLRATAPAAALAAPPISTDAPSDAGDEYAGAGAPAPATAAAAKGAPLDLAIPGSAPAGPTEFYNGETLYEKINGRAPAYQAFDFQELRARTFRPAKDDGTFVDVLEFRMASPTGAFGIYAAERESAGKPIDFAPEGYASEMGYFFRKGAYYVQVIASDPGAATLALAERIARTSAAALAGDDTGLAARRRLPEANLIPGTIAFVKSDALGLAVLKDVFQAKYRAGAAELPFLLMAAEPAQIEAAYAGCLEFSRKYGKVLKESKASDGTPYFVAESFGTFRVIFRRPNLLGGAFDAADAPVAEAFVSAYLAAPSP